MVTSVTPPRLQLEYLVCSNNFSPSEAVVLQEGLAQTPKTIPAKYFYDDRGSQLFEQICILPEYYVTRTEVSILQQHATTIANCTGPCELVELGSGSSLKTHLLLNAYQNAKFPLRYVPIDISGSILKESADKLLQEYALLHIHGMVGTYEQALANLAPAPHFDRRLIYFLGSSLGNMSPAECHHFFAQVSHALQEGDFFLLGADLQKDKQQLEAAYNDQQGITAQFNLNMLNHLNRRFGSNFNLDQFTHLAYYNTDHHRIEMHLHSTVEQVVYFQALDFQVHLQPGETILTEISRKFTLPQLSQELHSHGLTLVQHWTDDRQWFGLLLLQKK